MTNFEYPLPDELAWDAEHTNEILEEIDATLANADRPPTVVKFDSLTGGDTWRLTRAYLEQPLFEGASREGWVIRRIHLQSSLAQVVFEEYILAPNTRLMNSRIAFDADDRPDFYEGYRLVAEQRQARYESGHLGSIIEDHADLDNLFFAE